MSFREKSAWITFVTVLLAAAVFLAGAYSAGLLHRPGGLHLLIAIGVGLVVLQIALHILAAILNPKDARSPKDERERAIELRAHRVGYYVLISAVIAMFATGHATLSAHYLLYHALAAITLSTLAIALTQIVLFRLGR